jgi:hypothetical protein
VWRRGITPPPGVLVLVHLEEARTEPYSPASSIGDFLTPVHEDDEDQEEEGEELPRFAPEGSPVLHPAGVKTPIALPALYNPITLLTQEEVEKAKKNKAPGVIITTLGNEPRPQRKRKRVYTEEEWDLK